MKQSILLPLLLLFLGCAESTRSGPPAQQAPATTQPGTITELTTTSQPEGSNPVLADLHREQGQKFLEEKQYGKAVDSFTTALSMNSADAVTLVARAAALNKLKRCPEAREDCTQAIKLQPKMAEAYVERSLSMLSEKRFPEALADCQAAIDLGLNTARVYFNRGCAEKALGDKNKALEDYSQAIALDAKYFLAYNNRSGLYYEQKLFKLALKDADAGLAIDPNYVNLLSNRAGALIQLQQYKQALADCDYAITLDGSVPTVWYSRGCAHLQMGKAQNALDDFNRAIQLSPKSAEYYVERARAYHHLNNNKMAEQDCSEAIRIVPDYLDAFYNRSVYREQLKNYEGMKSDLTAVIALTGKRNQQPQLGLGHVFISRGKANRFLNRTEDALEDFTSALEHATIHHEEAYSNRAGCYIILKQYAKALIDADKAIALAPNRYFAYYHRAICYLNMKDYPKALADFNKDIELMPTDRDAYANRAYVHLALRHPEAAKADIAKVLSLNPRPELRDLMTQYTGWADSLLNPTTKPTTNPVASQAAASQKAANILLSTTQKSGIEQKPSAQKASERPVASQAATTQPVAEGQKITIEMSQPLPGGRGLGTTGYRPINGETPYLQKVTEKQIDLWSHIKMPKATNMTDAEWAKVQAEEKLAKAKMIPADDYQLKNQVGEYVGWCGIVRGVSWDEKQGVTTLLLEHKYFDGMTDFHIHVVSLYGAGDFTATVPGKVENIPMLSLVRVYGQVALGKDQLPTIKAEFIRVWDWGLFTFMDYGKDRTNPEWLKLRQVKGEDAYSPRPTELFYQERLGKRPKE